MSKTRISILVLGACGAVFEALRLALEEGQTLTAHSALALVCTALVAYALKYRGDSTPKEVEKRVAAARTDAASAARSSLVPQLPPLRAHRFASADELELPEEVTPQRPQRGGPR